MDKHFEIFTALITPYAKQTTNETNICEKTWGKIIERNISQGADGFFVGGSSGECFMLTNDERRRSFEVAAEFKSKTKLIAHVGCINTDEAIGLAKHAKRLGYDAVAALPPFYVKLSQQQIARHLIDIATESDMPLIIYNFPVATGVSLDITNEAIINLFKNPCVIGTKHTNIDLYTLERIKSVNSQLKVFNGYDETFVAGMALGADGAIGSTFNFTLPLFTRIREAFLQNDHENSVIYQQKANNVMEALVKSGLIASIKYALAYLGIDAGDVRRPLTPLDDASKKLIEWVIDSNFN